jgi:hypothetical protein
MSGQLSERAAWRALFHKCLTQSFPILPFPELPQDVAYVGWIIDSYRSNIRAQDEQLRRVVADLWAHVPRAEIELLDDATVTLCKLIHEQDEHG